MIICHNKILYNGQLIVRFDNGKNGSDGGIVCNLTMYKI